MGMDDTLWSKLFTHVYKVPSKPRAAAATSRKRRQAAPSDVTGGRTPVRVRIYDARAYGRFRSWARRRALPRITLATSLPFVAAHLHPRPLRPAAPLPHAGHTADCKCGQVLAALKSPQQPAAAVPGLAVACGLHHREDCHLHPPALSGAAQRLMLRVILHNHHPHTTYTVRLGEVAMLLRRGEDGVLPPLLQGTLLRLAWCDGTVPEGALDTGAGATVAETAVTLAYGQAASALVAFPFQDAGVEPAALERCKALVLPVDSATGHTAVPVPFVLGDTVWSKYTYLPGRCLTLAPSADGEL